MKVILKAGISTVSKELKAAAILETEEEESDKIRDCNYGITWKNLFEDMIEKYWEKDPKLTPLFLITLVFSNTKSHQSTVRVDYQQLPGCPMWLITRCMEIYRAIKSEMRKRKRQLDSVNAEKAAKRKTEGV